MDDTEHAVRDRFNLILDLPEIDKVIAIGPGVWRVVFADGITFGTAFAGDHPRSGEFDLTDDFYLAMGREAHAVGYAVEADGFGDID